MSYLEALARGLRGAGGVLSPGAFQAGQESDMLAQRGAQAAALQAQAIAARKEALDAEMGFRTQDRQDARAQRLFEFQQTQAARQQELIDRHKQRMDELAARNADALTRQQADQEFRRQMAEQAAQSRREMLAFAASLRQPVQGPAPQTVTNADGIFQIDRNGVATQVKTPDGQPLTGKQTPEKALPTSAAQKLFENQQNLRRAQQALSLIEQNPNATGVKGYLPEAILQRADPAGVDARAAISDLGSLVIHDRSGAAVTAAEFPRLRPFIPQATDNAETVKKKLSRFVQEYQKVVTETSDFYRESGYKVPTGSLQPAAPAAPSVDDLVKKYGG